jgi:hypothetical protein
MAFQALFDIAVRVTLIIRVRSQTGGDGLEQHAGKVNYIIYKRPHIPGGAKVKSHSMFNMLPPVQSALRHSVYIMEMKGNFGVLTN